MSPADHGADLLHRWTVDLGALCPLGDPAISAAGADIIRRWDHPGRHYHDLVHLGEVLTALDELTAAGELTEEDRQWAAAVAWFHDAVYDVEAPPGRSEESSAQLAVTVLTELGMAAAGTARIARLIRESATHEMTMADPVTHAFHDADLWILAAPRERFDAYCQQVRAEYAHVSVRDYGRGRSAVLAPFVARERLYLTDHAHAHWNEGARLNLTRELDRLAERG